MTPRRVTMLSIAMGLCALAALSSLPLRADDDLSSPPRKDKVKMPDAQYRPAIGDEAVLGTWFQVDFGFVPVFAGEYGLQEWYKSLRGRHGERANELFAQRQVFLVGSDTPIEILELGESQIGTDQYPLHGIRVEILDGPRKGSKGWVVNTAVLRFKEYDRDLVARAFENLAADDPPPAPVQAKPKSRRRGPAPAAPLAKLTVIDTAWQRSNSGNYVAVQGRVRNNTGADLDDLMVTITFEDAAGRLVKTEDALIAPSPLGPGEVGTFSVSTRSDARMDHFGVSFRTFAGGSVSHAGLR